MVVGRQSFIVTFLTFLVVVAAANDSDDLGRIVGGNNSVAAQFPYQVSLRQHNGHICGGSIISSKHILTAAHCVVEVGLEPYDAEVFNIRAGSHNRLSGGVIVPVKRITVHQGYTDYVNDLAVLELEQELAYSPKIQPIALASAEVPDGAQVTISGWGMLETEGTTAPIILQWNVLQALSAEKCCQKMRTCGDALICLNHAKDNGACFGDSGGPAVYNKQLIGVASFVVGGCGSATADGYASVAYNIDWIRKQMQ